MGDPDLADAVISMSYVDDLAIISKQPQKVIDALEKEQEFKLKGTGPITYHLGSDFFCDSEGVLCMAPKKYIDRMSDIYLRLFGTKPKTLYTSPLEKGDHPELDIAVDAFIYVDIITNPGFTCLSGLGRLALHTYIYSPYVFSN